MFFDSPQKEDSLKFWECLEGVGENKWLEIFVLNLIRKNELRKTPYPNFKLLDAFGRVRARNCEYNYYFLHLKMTYHSNLEVSWRESKWLKILIFNPVWKNESKTTYLNFSLPSEKNKKISFLKIKFILIYCITRWFI